MSIHFRYLIRTMLLHWYWKTITERNSKIHFVSDAVDDYTWFLFCSDPTKSKPHGRLWAQSHSGYSNHSWRQAQRPTTWSVFIHASGRSIITVQNLNCFPSGDFLKRHHIVTQTNINCLCKKSERKVFPVTCEKLNPGRLIKIYH